jgi:nucleotide-binding universal stress UspA family protein
VDERTRCFVVCTDETGRYDASVAKALDRAERDEAKVILYDVSAPGSAFSNPRPNEWAGEGEREVYDHPLDPVALEHLGRHLLAVAVMRARERGIDAYGWLPEKPGGDSLAAYAAQQHADLVLLPEDLAEKDLTDYFADGKNTPGLTVERV